MPKITLKPENKIVDVSSEKSLYEQFKEMGVHINSTCGGVASCSKCIVKVTSGSENMNEIPFEEKQLLGNVFHLTQERLCCQLFVSGDLTLDISDHQKVEKKEKKVLRRTIQEKNELIEQKQKERAENPPKVKEGGFKRPRAFKYEDKKEDTQE